MRKHILIAVPSLIFVSSAVFAFEEPAAQPQNPMPSAEQIIQFMDGNQNGAIEQSEAQGPLAEHFAFIDTDQDGKITADELKTAMSAREKMRAEHGDPHEQVGGSSSE